MSGICQRVRGQGAGSETSAAKLEEAVAAFAPALEDLTQAAAPDHAHHGADPGASMSPVIPPAGIDGDDNASRRGQGRDRDQRPLATLSRSASSNYLNEKLRLDARPRRSATARCSIFRPDGRSADRDLWRRRIARTMPPVD